MDRSALYYALFAISTFLTIIGIVILQIRRNTYPLRQKSPSILLLTLLSYWLLNAEITLRTATSFPCGLSLFLSHFALAPLFGCYFIRVIRLHIIFNLNKDLASLATGTLSSLSSGLVRIRRVISRMCTGSKDNDYNVSRKASMDLSAFDRTISENSRLSASLRESNSSQAGPSRVLITTAREKAGPAPPATAAATAAAVVAPPTLQQQPAPPPAAPPTAATAVHESGTPVPALIRIEELEITSEGSKQSSGPSPSTAHPKVPNLRKPTHNRVDLILDGERASRELARRLTGSELWRDVIDVHRIGGGARAHSAIHHPPSSSSASAAASTAATAAPAGAATGAAAGAGAGATAGASGATPEGATSTAPQSRGGNTASSGQQPSGNNGGPGSSSLGVPGDLHQSGSRPTAGSITSAMSAPMPPHGRPSVSLSPNELSKRRAYNIVQSRKMSSISFLLTRVYIPLLILHVVLFLIDWFVNYNSPNHQGSAACNFRRSFLYFSIFYFLFYALMLVLSGYLMVGVKEGFSMVRELVYVLLVFLAAGITLIILTFALSGTQRLDGRQITIYLASIGGMIISIFQPIYLSLNASRGQQKFFSSENPIAHTDDPMTIDHVLNPANSEAVAMFREFLDREFSSENLMFLEDVRLFSIMFDAAQDNPSLAADSRKAAALIFNRYFDKNAALPVNVSAPVFKQIELTFKNPQRDTFNNAVEHIKNLLSMDSFRRFARTEKYQQYVENYNNTQELIRHNDLSPMDLGGENNIEVPRA